MDGDFCLARGAARRTAQFTSGRSASHRTPVRRSISGQNSAGTRSFFHRETEAFSRPSAEANLLEPPNFWQASSRAEIMVASIVSGNYTFESRKAILHSRNIKARSYAFLMEFGDRLRDARNGANLTGEKLGERLGVSKQTIAHWEANRYEPKLVYLAKLCEVLDVSADWLLTGRSIENLSPAAVKQGRFYDALSQEGRRRWEAARMLIKGGSSDAPAGKLMPIAAPTPLNEVAESSTDPTSRANPEEENERPDTLITNHQKHVEFSIPNPSKSKGVRSDQSQSNPAPESPQRSEHAKSPSQAGRARRT